MYQYRGHSRLHYLLLFLFIGLLFSPIGITSAFSQAEEAVKSPSLLSDELLASPVKHYIKLSSRTNGLESPSSILQLALTQHLLGLHAELQTTLAQLQPLSVSQQPQWLMLYFFLVGADASKNAQFAQASRYLHYAQSLAEKNERIRSWVLITQEIAFAEALQERYEDAFLLLQEAYLKAQQYQGQFEIALVEQTLGGVYSYTDNYDQANHYYQQALKRYQLLQFPAYIAETRLGIATTFRHQKKWIEALQAYEEYYQSIAFQGVLGDSFYYHYGKSITLALSGKCTEAEAGINAAVAANGPRDYLGELYKKQAICALKKGLVPAARRALSSARTIIDQTPELVDTLWQAELLKIESDIANSAGDQKKALALFQQYHEVATRLQSKKASSRLFDLKVALESERKDAQIQQLEQKSRLQALQILAKEAQQQRSALVIGCAILIFILLSGVIYYQRRKTQHLYELSVHDPLTNLFNRRHAISVIEHWLEKHRSERQVFSVFIIDIDHFKQVNDTYGHPIGDKLLVAIANAASTIIRPSDVLARFGGEEFICLLPRISTEEAERIAERIRQKVDSTAITLDDGATIQRTVSIGITHVDFNDLDINSILKRADVAMYQAKEAGRNRVSIN